MGSFLPGDIGDEMRKQVDQMARSPWALLDLAIRRRNRKKFFDMKVNLPYFTPFMAQFSSALTCDKYTRGIWRTTYYVTTAMSVEVTSTFSSHTLEHLIERCDIESFVSQHFMIFVYF